MENPIEALIQVLSRLPGLGSRSGRRLALHLLKRKDSLLAALIDSLAAAKDNAKICKICGNIDVSSPCQICDDPLRDVRTLCIVQDVADLWALERSRQYKGVYHVLGGLLSAVEGTGPEDLRLEELKSRITNDGITEAIIALPVTVEGQTTSFYIAETLHSTGVKITTLARGVPVGGELDYLDEATIKTALSARRDVVE